MTDARLEELIAAWRADLASRGQQSRAAAAELEDHLRELISEYREAGEDTQRAFERALAQIGAAQHLDSELRRAARTPGHAPHHQDESSMRTLFDQTLQDLRHAVRLLFANPAFTATAVLTLALGIGANSAIFSLTRATLFKAPPVSEPERLAAIWTTCRSGTPRCSSSYPDYLDYRERATVFEDLAAYTWARASLGDDRGARLVTIQGSTGNYFSLLGVQPADGRLYTPQDERAAVAVLSHGLWRDHFGLDPAVVGRVVRLNQGSFTIVGVTPEAFEGLHVDGGPDLYIPLLSLDLLSDPPGDGSNFEARGSRWIAQLVGRLGPGVTLDQARAQMDAASEQMRQEDPDARGPRNVTIDAADRLILPAGNEDTLVRFVTILAGVVGFTLLLACANLANLLLLRATGRTHELSVRVAVGATHQRLVRQMLTESVVLALVGGAAGVLLGQWILRLLSAYQLPGNVPIAAGVSNDPAALTYTLVLSVLTGLAFGALPALRAGRAMGTALRSGDRRSSGTGGTRSTLVAVQVALCVVLLVGSALFTQALRNGLETDLGFESRGVAFIAFDLSLLGYTPAQSSAFVEAFQRRLEAHPTIEAAGAGVRIPLMSGGSATMLQSVEGYEAAADEELRLEYNVVDAGYLRALGLPLLQGRLFEPADDDGSRHLIINADMAERWWAGRRAAGGAVMFFGDTPADVIGVVGNTRWDDGIAADRYPFAYMLASADSPPWSRGRTGVIARTTGDAEALLPILRDELRALDPNVSIVDSRTLPQLLETQLAPQRMGATLLTLFSALALTLSVIGIHGVVSYSVRQSWRELGVRVALGAASSAILGHVLRGVLTPVIAGVALGSVVALWLGRLVNGFMYGISASDPGTYVLVTTVLFLSAAFAALIPARRASGVDPAVALQLE